MFKPVLVAACVTLATGYSSTPVPDAFAEPPQCPYSGPHDNLRSGSAVITHLQCLLRNVWGYDVAIDGDLGPGTRSAVRDHQIDCAVTPDGVVGPNTWLLLHPDTATPECLDD
jgi:peptidoglycan hydrolase-like protein with peptidoglycan-binding domain